MCSSFVLELSSFSLWLIEILKVGMSFSRISFWESLLVDPIVCPQSLGRIGVRLDGVWIDLGFCGEELGSIGSTDASVGAFPQYPL